VKLPTSALDLSKNSGKNELKKKVVLQNKLSKKLSDQKCLFLFLKLSWIFVAPEHQQAVCNSSHQLLIEEA